MAISELVEFEWRNSMAKYYGKIRMARELECKKENDLVPKA